MKKKLLPILLLVVIVFNFIFCNTTYADDARSNNNRYGGNSTLDGESVRATAESGKSANGHEMKQENSGSSVLGVVMQFFALVINTLPMGIHGLMSLTTKGRNISNKFGTGYGKPRLSVHY